ncbi:MAG TPA: peptide deformylase [Candidatus Hydrogenedentes bacterium]|nr:peptide deformylase [Candidatus Hydrogenedentota bacterium]
MAIRDILWYPDDRLLKKASAYEHIGADVAELAQDMLETMFFYDGVGLAGPQVGISKRILVLCEPEGDPMCLVNPEIYEKEGCAEGEEGCLSLPQLYALVPRATRIRVRALDEHGAPLDFEARDFLARIIQHESDHLDGTLFPDRLDILSREDLLQQWQEIHKQLTKNAKHPKSVAF